MRVLVVGCGSIGRRHMRNLRSLRDDIDLIAYRHTGRDADLLGREFGLRSFYDLEKALAEQPDFALITNPTSLHIPAAIEVARRGCRLFIEKPLSHSMEGVDELIALVREQDLVTLVGFNLRFHPGLRLVKSLLDEECIGRVVSIRAQVGQYLPDWHPWEDYRQGYSAQRDLGGGVILDLIHELDVVYWLMGEIHQVACFAGHVSGLEIDTEDVAEILLRFGSGAVGNVHLDYVQRSPSRTCRIIGEKGTITWDYFANEVRLFEVRHPGWQQFRQDGFDRNDTFVAEMQHFLACLEGQEKPTVDVEAGARILQLALAARESAEAGGMRGL